MRNDDDKEFFKDMIVCEMSTGIFGQCPSKVLTPLFPQLKLWKQMTERRTYYCTYVRQQKKSYIELGEHELNQYTVHLPAFLGLLSILRFLLPPPPKQRFIRTKTF